MHKGEDIYYEAAVAGAIPIIRPLRDSLAGDFVTRLMGIVNGTTNYILTKMHEDNREFADVLKEAQALGYAEADPTADMEGFDAAAKAAIFSGLAFTLALLSTMSIVREFQKLLSKMFRYC
jgi:homoserine dehydrogenase